MLLNNSSDLHVNRMLQNRFKKFQLLVTGDCSDTVHIAMRSGPTNYYQYRGHIYSNL